MKIKLLLKDLIHLIYPNNCLVCGETLIEGENIICTSCLYKIPKTNNHLIPENEIEKRFWGKVQLENAAAYYRFHKESPIQKLLHELKYNKRQDVGELLGKQISLGLQKNNFFEGIDIIIPVPLHKKRYQERGFNQSACFAKGLSDVIEKAVNTTTLYRAIENPTQTKKNVYERWENTHGIFKLTEKDSLKNKHILLVDDVMTTGATLEACANTLSSIEGAKITVLTIAGA